MDDRSNTVCLRVNLIVKNKRKDHYVHWNQINNRWHFIKENETFHWHVQSQMTKLVDSRYNSHHSSYFWQINTTKNGLVSLLVQQMCKKKVLWNKSFNLLGQSNHMKRYQLNYPISRNEMKTMCIFRHTHFYTKNYDDLIVNLMQLFVFK